jgi:hypothetical protein
MVGPAIAGLMSKVLGTGWGEATTTMVRFRCPSLSLSAGLAPAGFGIPIVE